MISINIGDEKLESEIQLTKDEFKKVSLGQIEISEAGNQIITFQPIRGKWKNVELEYVELVKK